MSKSVEIRVRGLVQGVGFRPFIYKLAKKFKLKGFVLNDTEGVKIQIFGLPTSINRFLKEMKSSPPPLSEIAEVQLRKIANAKFKDFSIVESKSSRDTNTLISPDIATCPDCLNDMVNPANRRYMYPFTNCTNCGPRFTIINKVPYDRPNTTMRTFKMCEECLLEYHNPLDRRFHAQPNACPKCGPKLILLDRNLRVMNTLDPLGEAIRQISNGKVVAVKGIGGFHLACDACNPLAVERLRASKAREEKPLAIMCYSSDTVSSIASVSPFEKRLLESPERPIVLVKKRPKSAIAESVAPSNIYYGVILPYTPLHHLLFTYDVLEKRLGRMNFKALVMTSANISEEPIVKSEKEAKEYLPKVFDLMLSHNRDIYTRTDDSVVRAESKETFFIRRARGFAPSPIYLKTKFRDILAVGAELKNTVCLTKGNNAFLSQHIGDLKNLGNYEFFRKCITKLKNILSLEPNIIAFDMHPNYLSSKYAIDSKIETKIAVQHHHAHMASCMIENNLEGQCIGIILDGTGYGIDGTIWGGEILVGDMGNFQRKAHLRAMKMPGGDAAVMEPLRMAFSYIYAVYGRYWENLDIDFIDRIGRDRLKFFEQMILTDVNSPVTSGLGRLFDAVSSLSGIKDYNTYEGQAAMELEMAIGSQTDEKYPFTIYKEDNNLIINTVPLIEEIVLDLKEKKKKDISAKFHNTVIAAFADTTLRIAKETGLKNVVFSGGCFQNAYLLKNLGRTLTKKGLKVFVHRKIPTNDGGISLGQAAVANRIVQTRK